MAKKNQKKEVEHPGLHKVAGLCVLSVALFLLLSLISYNALDPSWSVNSSSSDIHNWMGRVGSYMADGFMIVFGLIAYLIPIFLLEQAYTVAFSKKPQSWLSYLSTFVIFVVLLSFMGVIFSKPLDIQGAEVQAGGVVGSLIGGALKTYLNTWGSLVILLTMLVAGLMVGYDLPGAYAKLKIFIANQRLRRERARVKRESLAEEKAERKVEQAKIKPKKEKKIEKPREPQITITEHKERIAEEVPVQVKLDFAADYQLPPVSLINEAKASKQPITEKELKANAALILAKLDDFGVRGEILEIKPGPVITMYEFTPAPGIKITKIVNLADDLAMALKATSVRVVAPIPGKNAVGIEIPNRSREVVGLRKILANKMFAASSESLLMALGSDTEGAPVVANLAKMPHLLIAGATGTGKSVGLNTMILSLLYRCNPNELKFIMIDPKRIELSHYEDIPHLIHPVVTDPAEALPVLKWAVQEMEMRYELFKGLGVKSVETYNKKIKKVYAEAVPGLASVKPDDENKPFLLPKMVIVIDEMADLMMVNKEVESFIARLAQMARAAGMHMIVATQRPSVDVITGLIKANFPTRISFRVSSKTDSRTILDSGGADQLLGMGDMLYLSPGAGGLMRVHGAYVSEDELDSVVEFIKKQQEPEYLDAVEEQISQISVSEITGGGGDDMDPMYDQALDFVTQKGLASISMVQRQFRIGYNRAARIIDQMESEGILGPAEKAGKPRKVLVKSYAEMEQL